MNVAHLTAEQFNALVAVGTSVIAYPITRADEPLFTKTRTPAWTLGHGEVVVSVEGYAGGIALTHIDVMRVVETAQAFLMSDEDRKTLTNLLTEGGKPSEEQLPRIREALNWIWPDVNFTDADISGIEVVELGRPDEEDGQ